MSRRNEEEAVRRRVHARLNQISSILDHSRRQLRGFLTIQAKQSDGDTERQPNATSRPVLGQAGITRGEGKADRYQASLVRVASTMAARATRS